MDLDRLKNDVICFCLILGIVKVCWIWLCNFCDINCFCLLEILLIFLCKSWWVYCLLMILYFFLNFFWDIVFIVDLDMLKNKVIWFWLRLGNVKVCWIWLYIFCGICFFFFFWKEILLNILYRCCWVLFVIFFFIELFIFCLFVIKVDFELVEVDGVGFLIVCWWRIELGNIFVSLLMICFLFLLSVRELFFEGKLNLCEGKLNLCERKLNLWGGVGGVFIFLFVLVNSLLNVIKLVGVFECFFFVLGIVIFLIIWIYLFVWKNKGI